MELHTCKLSPQVDKPVDNFFASEQMIDKELRQKRETCCGPVETPTSPQHAPLVVRLPNPCGLWKSFPPQRDGSWRRYATSSTMVALAIPPPSHIVCRP